MIAVQEPGSLIRSLIQTLNRIRTVFIYTSTTTYSYFPRKEEKAFVGSHYSLLIFDTAFSSQMSINFLQRNRNFIKEYYDVGMIRSDIVYDLRNNAQQKDHLKEIFKIPCGKKVIGFFDDTIGRTGMFSCEEGRQMYSDMLRLLEEHENYVVLFGTRNLRRILKGSPVYEDFERLAAHKRCIAVHQVTDRYEAYELMGLSQVNVVCFPGSAPQESLAGGVPTVCYISREEAHARSSIYVQFPFFFVEDYSGLHTHISHWVNVTAEKFEQYQSAYIKPYIDSYCDGKARHRLREYLASLTDREGIKSGKQKEAVLS
jgi:hypothetical protein